MVWYLHIYFRKISVPHSPYSQVIGFVAGIGPATGLGSIYNGVTWPPEGALFPAVAQEFLQAPV